MVEALIVLAILALIAAMIIPVAKSQLDKSEVAAVGQNLQSIRDGILAYRENVGFYPSQLMQLTTKPGVAGVTTNNSCGAATPAASIARWRGPYIAQEITASGIPSGDVVILNALVRTPANATLPNPPEGTLAVEVDEAFNSPDHGFVGDVEKMFDGSSSDLATGAIRWTPTVPLGIVGRLTFHIAVRNC